MVRHVRTVLAALAAAGLAALGLPAAAPAEVPGQVEIEVTCGTESFHATSGLGGFAAWIADRDGQRVVLRPVAVTGIVTDAEGGVRPFSQEHPRHVAAPTTACAFTFAMGEGAGAVTLAGQGEFLVGPR